ncbi:Protein sel-1 1 [Cyanidiococcus yangmingshanensis]|uniref:Protein sel-1 1 n=1 Tax=Cyanidiococcus yangmingshanensis TaxID=2690220 RepID=A0A7J7IEQ3_9RHOD|nr:Protein sel-1 1 [Cyanidiococcus yangmingshanensis]
MTGRERGPRRSPRWRASLRSAFVLWVLFWLIGFVILHGLRISEAKTPAVPQSSAASETARSPGTRTAAVEGTNSVTWTERAPAFGVQRPSADASSTSKPDKVNEDVVSAEKVDSIPASGFLTPTWRQRRNPAPSTSAQATVGRLATGPFGSKPSPADNQRQENQADRAPQGSALARDESHSTATSSSENSNSQPAPPPVTNSVRNVSETMPLSEHDEELLEIVDEHSANDVPLDVATESVLETQSATRTRERTMQHRPVPLTQQVPFVDAASRLEANADPIRDHREDEHRRLKDEAAAAAAATSVTVVDKDQIRDGAKEDIHDDQFSDTHKTSVASTGIASADAAMMEDSVTEAFVSPTKAAPVPHQTEIQHPQPLPSTALSMETFLSLLGWRLNGHQVEQLTQQVSDEQQAMDDRQIALYALEIIQEVLRLDAQLMELIPHSDRAPMLDDWWPALKERTTMEVLQLTTQLQLVRLQVGPPAQHSNPDPTPSARLFRHRLDALAAELDASFEAMMILVERGEQHLFALATPQGLNLVELRPLKERITRWRMRMQKERAKLQRRLLDFDRAASPWPTAAAEELPRQTKTLSPLVADASSGTDHSDPVQEAMNTTAPSSHQTSTGEPRSQPASWVTQVEQLWRTKADLVRIQEILETAADSGDVVASSTLARLLWFGDSERLFRPNRSRALHYLQQAVAAGQPDAHDLAATLELVNGNASSLKRALLHVHRAAMDGQAHAQMVVAFRYLYGLGGLPEDCNQAVRFYRLAAAHAVHDTATTNDPSRYEPRAVPAFASKAMESELNLEREIRRRTLRFRRTMPLEAFRLSAEDARRIRRFATQRRRFWANMAAKASETSFIGDEQRIRV